MGNDVILRFGAGHAVLDRTTGAPTRICCGGREYLIDPGLPWHTASHYWGAGHTVTDFGAAQWATARDRTFDAATQTQTLRFDLASAGLALEITRRADNAAGVLHERYVWRNVTGRALRITGLGVQTPWNDRYPGARRSLAQCVNAHVFAGGEGAWALAVPMSGEGLRLGLVVREGAVNAYSVESRNNSTLSNVRGHIVMQVTDRARNPRAFGGQPAIELGPGDATALAWDLAWYADDESFLADAMPGVWIPEVSATIGNGNGGIRVSGARIANRADLEAGGVTVLDDGNGERIAAARPGMVPLDLVRDADGRRMRTEALFHEPLRKVVEERARYILAHQRAEERPGDLAGAFVPVDTRTGLRIDAGGWSDWSDGSERIGMAVMLQRAWVQGVLPADLRDPVRHALDDWAAFARAHLLDASGAIRRGSFLPASAFGQRIYDAPWMAELFCTRYRMTGDPADLDLAVRIVRRANELGAERFLAIGYAEVNEELVGLLEASGRDGDTSAAADLRATVTRSADHFLALGVDLPAHEVSYEQSMVAPLVNLLIGAHRLTGDPRYLEDVRERLRWLLAFGGPQPDARLYGVALRHWDGYWFGMRRQYGDVFPHYWSALTATALARLPESLRTDRTDALAMAIMRANMANYRPDGTATCAFVFPSAVDGEPAHAADPLANDQDWHLAIWLRLIAREGFAEA